MPAMLCHFCDIVILPRKERTSINDVHYHTRCYERKAAKDKKRRADATGRERASE